MAERRRRRAAWPTVRPPGAGRALLFLATWAAASFVGCGPAATAERPNILLISIDTLRADHLSCYGYSRPTSPAIDRLAAEGVLFEQVVASSPWTLPSHASMLTGLNPRNHGLKSRLAGLQEDIPTLAMLLRDGGYTTMALVNAPDFLPRHGLHRGFEKYREYPPREGGRRVRSGKRQVAQAINWLEEGFDRPFFMFIHNYDVHSGYDPAPEFLDMFATPYDGKIKGSTADLMRARHGELTLSEDDLRHLIDRYDGGIRQLDSELALLFEYLDRRGLSDSTVVIVTSDHGEEFLEHGGVLHGQTMYSEMLDVPLILRGPGLPAGKRILGLAGLSDITPTVLVLAGVDVPKMDGMDLTPTWEVGGAIPEDRLTFAEADHRNAEEDIKRMVRVGDVKLIYDRLARRQELYDLSRDPSEHRDLATAEPETVQLLMRYLERYEAGEARDAVELPPLSQEELENLRSLGYLQ
jgi:arylsulfatase A-like enzyme